jgi:hypothetical protein
MRTQLPVIVGRSVDGIFYPSARANGRNVILFHDRTTCIRKGDPAAGAAQLAIDESSIEILDHEEAGRIAEAAQATHNKAGIPGRWSAWETWAVQRLMLGLPPR